MVSQWLVDWLPDGVHSASGRKDVSLMLYKNFICHSPKLVPLPNSRESELQEKAESLCQHLAQLGKPSAHSPALLSFLAGEITEQEGFA